jgi:peptide subunit release factor 1 (eRF1)
MLIAPPANMAKPSPDLDTLRRDHLMALAAFEPHGVPVISLYLNLRPDQHGRDHYEVFARKAFAEQLKRFDERSAERASLERDVERINRYLALELNRSANGVAIFASSGAAEFFEAIQLQAPIDHWLFVGEVPHIYPLVRLIDQYPRYAAVQLDTNSARIVVFGLGAVEKSVNVTGIKTRRHAMGGSSQARYQRHLENFHLHHVKEVVDTLDRVVRADNIQRIIVAGDEVAIPLLKEQLPAHLSEKLVDVMKLDRQANDDEIAEATLEVLRQKDAETDSERVQSVVDAWRGGGLGVMGPEATLRALQLGQVEELLIAATPQGLKPVQTLPDDAVPEPVATQTATPGNSDHRQLHLSDELVTRAKQTAARIRMIEDPELLRAHGGVGAMLRFRV